MTRITLFLLVLTLAISANGQILEFQAGTSFSKIKDIPRTSNGISQFYDETLIAYSIFAGIDYFEKKSFNLSSNIGFIQRGGQGDLPFVNEFGELTGQIVTQRPTLNYLSVNSTIDLKHTFKELVSPFVSVGPRLDYLASHSSHYDASDNTGRLNSVSLGMLLGTGLNFHIDEIQLGFRADYYWDFTRVESWEVTNLRGGAGTSINTFVLNATVGYRLKYSQ